MEWSEYHTVAIDDDYYILFIYLRTNTPG